MENKTKNSQTTLFEITIRVQAQNFQIRRGRAAGWIALLLIVGIRVAAYFLKGAQ
jgi:hypothetical protein